MEFDSVPVARSPTTDALLRVLGDVVDHVICFAPDGSVIYEGPRWATLPNAADLAAEAHALVQRARQGGAAPASRVSVGAFTFAAYMLPAGVITEQPATLVTLKSTGGDPVPDAEIAARYRLTPRQMEVVGLIARGEPNRRIATLLGLSTNTVQNHTRAVLRKLGVARRGAVASRLFRSRHS